MAKILRLISLFILFSSAIGFAQNITGTVTFFGWNDNDPPSDQIAYPKVKHGKAMQTAGTYENPNTAATDPKEFAPGTILYVPFLRKYVIIEDLCGQCVKDWKNKKHHIDIWMGPNRSSPNSLIQCENSKTRSGVKYIANPPKNLPVEPTLFYTNNQCTAKTF